MTRMAVAPGSTDGDNLDRWREADDPMAPDLVAPMVAYLSHERCEVSGEIYTAGAGRFARVVWATTDGYLHPDGAPTPEDIADHWAEINDSEGWWVPADLMAWSARFLSHLDR